MLVVRGISRTARLVCTRSKRVGSAGLAQRSSAMTISSWKKLNSSLSTRWISTSSLTAMSNGTNAATQQQEDDTTQLTERFNSALRDLLNQGNIHALFLIFEDMLELGVRPDADTYNVLIRGCLASNDLQGAKEMFASIPNPNPSIRSSQPGRRPLTINLLTIVNDPTILTDLLEEIRSRTDMDLKDITSITGQEWNTMLTSLIAVRDRELAEYVLEQRRQHPRGSVAADPTGTKLEELVSKIPENSKILPDKPVKK